jgi:hypothetical protein
VGANGGNCSAVPSLFSATNTRAVIAFTKSAHGLTSNTLARGNGNNSSAKIYVLAQI